MTTKTKTNVTVDLRAQLVAIDGHQVELLAERDEISYLALVDHDQKSIERLQAINAEIENLKTQAASIEPALREATRREGLAKEQELAGHRRADAEQAGMVMAEAERIAALMDIAMIELKKHGIEFLQAMAKVRQLSGVGPQHTAVLALLSRATKAGLMGLPQYSDVLQPHERRTVAEIAATYALQVRNRIESVCEAAKAPAGKPMHVVLNAQPGNFRHHQHGAEIKHPVETAKFGHRHG